MRTLTLLSLICLTLGGCKKDEATAAVVPSAPTAKAGPPRIELAVTDEGFVPANITLKAGQPVTFVVTRKTDETCATELLIDGTDIQVALPLNQSVEVAWTPKTAGQVKFGCAMDKMIGGVLLVE